MIGKTSLARRLAKRECGGDYADALIILAAAISAIAADIWPGDGIDKRRFVQLLVDYADPRFHASRVSIPLLIANSRIEGRTFEQATLASRYTNYPGSMVLTGALVDQAESTVAVACPALTRAAVRRCCYASVFYTEIRSALAHEFRFGESADPSSMAEGADADEVTYGNWWGEPDRHIHFPLEWVCGVAESVAAAVDAAPSAGPVPRSVPWWIDEP
jgi:hypothetical protein